MTVVASGMAMSMVYYTRYTIYMIIIIMTCNVYNISAIVIPRIFGWGPAGGAGGVDPDNYPLVEGEGQPWPWVNSICDNTIVIMCTFQ